VLIRLPIVAIGIFFAIAIVIRSAPGLFGAGLPEVAAAAGAAPPAAAAAAPQPASRGARQAVLRADALGHFNAEASVDGRQVDFLVDTGATMVALDAATARRLNLRPEPGAAMIQVSTANGAIFVRPVRLREIRVGSVVVRDVEAVVVAAGALDGNLLGMTFLNRLRRYAVEGDQLVLNQ